SLPFACRTSMPIRPLRTCPRAPLGGGHVGQDDALTCPWAGLGTMWARWAGSMNTRDSDGHVDSPGRSFGVVLADQVVTVGPAPGLDADSLLVSQPLDASVDLARVAERTEIGFGRAGVNRQVLLDAGD